MNVAVEEVVLFLRDLLRKNKTNNVVLMYLNAKFGLQWSCSTLKRFLKDHNLRRHDTLSANDVLKAVELELKGSGQLLGARSLHLRIRMHQGLLVKREQVELALQYLALSQVVARGPGKKNVLRKRKYISKGPNWCWHIDGYDKLSRWGIFIHGAIDGFSRKIIWLKAYSTNKQPWVIAKYYMQHVCSLNVVPSFTCSDVGTETGLVASCQCFLRRNSDDDLAGENSHKFVKSTTNQRIEAFWSQLRKMCGDFWISFFEDMEFKGLLDVTDSVHRHCFLHLFLPLLQKELDDFREQHNSHRIRKQKDRRVPNGVPDDLYLFPGIHGFQDMGHAPTRDDLAYLEERFSFSQPLGRPVPSTFIEAVNGVLPEDFADDASRAEKNYQRLLNFFQNFY